MEFYAGLDMSLESTSVCVVDGEGKLDSSSVTGRPGSTPISLHPVAEVMLLSAVAERRCMMEWEWDQPIDLKSAVT
ncbi:hypothetical protein SMD10_06075, partial [Consotaella sp. CSK11QG-6]